MSRTERGALQRIDPQLTLPVGFDKLSDQVQLQLIQKMAETDVELYKVLKEKVGKSQLAEHDLAVMIETVQKLDEERKIYTQHSEGETGSGKYKMVIRGGDTKFIVPIIVAVGAIILGIVLILALVGK